MQKENLEFGSGSFVGQALNDPAFYELPVRDQAKIVGWANGCPVVDELTDPGNTDPGRGPENMLERYAKTNFWFGYIAREVQERDPELYDQLITPVKRLPDEPVGKYEAASVPESYGVQMAPMNTLVGYALPRLFAKQLGDDLPQLPLAESQARFSRGLNVLDKAIDQAKTPAQLLALFAEGLSQDGDVTPMAALSGALSPGWLEEHNGASMLEDVKTAMAENASTLWPLYQQLSDEDKARGKIA